MIIEPSEIGIHIAIDIPLFSALHRETFSASAEKIAANTFQIIGMHLCRRMSEASALTNSEANVWTRIIA